MKKQANQEQMWLYARMGEAVCQIQILEQALSHCITIKMHPELNEADASVHLAKNQNTTFGTVVKLAGKKNVYPPTMQKLLEDLLAERNWLVHHAMRDSQQGNRIVVQESILNRIKDITDNAERLQQLLEWDLIDFSESQGRNVTNIKQIMLQEKGPRPVLI